MLHRSLKFLALSMACANVLYGQTTTPWDQAAGPRAPEAISLGQAIRMAEQNKSPEVVLQETRVREAKAEHYQASWSWLPYVGTYGTAGTFTTGGVARQDPLTGEFVPGNVGAVSSVNAGVGISLDLMQFARRGSEMEAAMLRANGYTAKALGSRYRQALFVTERFFDALASQHLVRAREQSLRRAEESLRIVTERVSVGKAITVDSLQAVSQRDRIISELANSRALLAGAEAALARQIGLDGRAQASDDPSFYSIRPYSDVSTLRSDAQRSPEIAGAGFLLEAAGKDLQSAKRLWLPSVRLNGNQNANAVNFRDFQIYPQSIANIQVSFAFFDGGARGRLTQQKSAAYDFAQAVAADTRREVLAAVAAQSALLQAAEQRIGLSESGIHASTEELRTQQERYSVGRATAIDLMRAQESLTRATVEQILARFDLLRSRAAIEALLGRNL